MMLPTINRKASSSFHKNETQYIIIRIHMLIYIEIELKCDVKSNAQELQNTIMARRINKTALK